MSAAPVFRRVPAMITCEWRGRFDNAEVNALHAFDTCGFQPANAGLIAL